MNWSDYHARVHKTLRQRQLLPPKTRVLLAVSGGQDSVALLQLLYDLKRKWQWELAVAHCDHRWRSDAGMADHVQGVVEPFQIPFFLLRANSPVAETEASARAWRYQVLTECCHQHGYRYLVTAHTCSDRAETLLYNLIRGSGSDGLGTLTWQRSLTDSIDLIRPMLNLSRGETLQICQQLGLPIWEDTANQNLAFARNRIRQQILPQIKTHFNPQVETALSQTAEILQAETDYLHQLATELLEKAGINTSQQSLDRGPLKDAPLALQRRVMRLFWERNISHAPNFEQIEELTRLIQGSNRDRSSSFPGQIYAEVENDYICFRLFANP